mmetsp:Transcript_37203/g.112495  ORF Transcript_37203/g.112495 Transcript_37203/m.112495 type:complete len:512 (+) Transcript_37203:534-2069(+)
MDFSGAANAFRPQHVPHGHGALLGKVPQRAAEVDGGRAWSAAARLPDRDPGVAATEAGLPHGRHARHSDLLAERPPRSHGLGHRARQNPVPLILRVQPVSGQAAHCSQCPGLPRLPGSIILDEAVQGPQMRLHAALDRAGAAWANALALPKLGAPLRVPPRQERGLAVGGLARHRVRAVCFARHGAGLARPPKCRQGSHGPAAHGRDIEQPHRRRGLGWRRGVGKLCGCHRGFALRLRLPGRAPAGELPLGIGHGVPRHLHGDRLDLSMFLSAFVFFRTSPLVHDNFLNFRHRGPEVAQPATLRGGAPLRARPAVADPDPAAAVLEHADAGPGALRRGRRRPGGRLLALVVARAGKEAGLARESECPTRHLRTRLAVPLLVEEHPRLAPSLLLRLALATPGIHPFLAMRPAVAYELGDVLRLLRPRLSAVLCGDLATIPLGVPLAQLRTGAALPELAASVKRRFPPRLVLLCKLDLRTFFDARRQLVLPFLGSRLHHAAPVLLGAAASGLF